MKSKTLNILTALLIGLLATFPSLSIAHSGGLNASGCHGGSQPYHCHRSSSDMVTTQDGRNRLKCSLGSKSVECSSPSTSSTLIKKSEPSLATIQKKLEFHCPSLLASLSYNSGEKEIQQALKTFQVAYGLNDDGIYGPLTEAALDGPVNGKCD